MTKEEALQLNIGDLLTNKTFKDNREFGYDYIVTGVHFDAIYVKAKLPSDKYSSEYRIPYSDISQCKELRLISAC